MNKKSWIIITVIVALLIGGGIFLYFKNMSSLPDKNNYEANKTSTDNTSNQTENNNDNTENQQDKNTANEVTQGINETEKNPPTTEEQISTFTTKIYSSDSARQNNISITCTTLNETIVKNGETFSFCNTIGPSSTSKGYQKADIYDRNGNKKKGLGGRKLSN